MAAAAPDFNLYQCNPATLGTTKTTCLPFDMLVRLRAAWNKTHPDHAIPLHLRRKEEIWAALRDRMRRTYKCQSEFCAVQHVGDAELKDATAGWFRPRVPPPSPPPPGEEDGTPSGKGKGKDGGSKRRDPLEEEKEQWQTTESIAAVMEQYELAIPSFEFIGPVPIDFDSQLPGQWGRCVVDELCNLNLQLIRSRGDTSVGIIFNLDPHDKDGSHWVCAFLDLNKGNAYYYDSYGMPPGPEIRRLLRRCRDQGCRNIFWNDVRHQHGEIECGTYCMYILISLLKGRSFADLCRRKVNDRSINTIRDLLFATEVPRDSALSVGRSLLPL